MERFQALLQRSPHKLKQQRISNKFPKHILADKLNKRIKKHFTKNIIIPDYQESNAGGLQTPSQFRAVQNLSGMINSNLTS